jgi:hypothetical protein
MRGVKRSARSLERPLLVAVFARPPASARSIGPLITFATFGDDSRNIGEAQENLYHRPDLRLPQTVGRAMRHYGLTRPDSECAIRT